MEYVEENIKNADIETALSSWGRKNTVKEAELKRLNNRIKQVTALLEQKKKTGKPPVMPLNTPGSRNSAAASRLTSRLHSAVSNSAGRQEVSTLDIQVGNNEK